MDPTTELASNLTVAIGVDSTRVSYRTVVILVRWLNSEGLIW
jgi:hypothetical protein